MNEVGKARAFIGVALAFLACTVAAAPLVYNAPANVSLTTSSILEVLPVVTPNGACTATASRNIGISSDYRSIHTCAGGYWRAFEGVHWAAPVAVKTSLPSTDPVNTVRMVTGLGYPFAWNGSAWTPLSIDESGNLLVGNQVRAAVATISSAVTVGSVSSSGPLAAGAIASNSTAYSSGRITTSTDNWGMVLRTSAGGDNAQPQSGVASVYANDVYLRSIGRWASQMANRRIYTQSYTFKKEVSLYLGAYKFCVLDNSTYADYTDHSYWISANLYYNGSAWILDGNPGDDQSSTTVTVTWSCYL